MTLTHLHLAAAANLSMHLCTRCLEKHLLFSLDAPHQETASWPFPFPRTRSGRAVCGTWLWLAMQAVLAAVWWLILLWMVFVIFGSCVWYAAAYILEGALAYTLTLSRTLSQTLNSTAVNATTYAAGTNATLQCPEYCFNSAYFSFYSSIQVRRVVG